MGAAARISRTARKRRFSSAATPGLSGGELKAGLRIQPRRRSTAPTKGGGAAAATASKPVPPGAALIGLLAALRPLPLVEANLCANSSMDPASTDVGSTLRLSRRHVKGFVFQRTIDRAELLGGVAMTELSYVHGASNVPLIGEP